MKKIFMLLMTLVILPSICFGAGTFTAGDKYIWPSVNRGYITCTSDAGGDCTGTLTGWVDGEVRVVINPDAVAVPTDQFDLTIVDDGGADILDGNGTDLSNAATTNIAASGSSLVSGDLDFTLSGMGDSKIVVIWLFWR